MEYLNNLVAADNPSSVLMEMMEAYGQDVWNYAYFLTRRRDAADDISQDVFLKALQHLRQFEGRSSVKTWLFAITRNLSMNYLKSSFIKKVTLVEWVTPKRNERSAEMEAIGNMEVSRIWQHVLSLPVKFREVLILEFHYQLPRREIAALLDISEGTVKSRLHRARARMEALLKGEEAE
ncbi:RNA polymerase sigma-70 factor, ECF subfamily [Paenibacillus uliginis N3/975]|uniref:RNA polymerase sigma-70 factor, ECF subfamily n=1 Tax=Paenibacillus uliginis N3/975 TaxID=1313296 RepID=A0A1X7HMU9_9BACL|nr:sigma-70 family RNA polymerase sigma factor [Paenibacillus uliginis]SMF89624.1 RNA polymerase sigma-70 factor, ECF subfamily [Paenibacillus uliginis N3/975]